MARDAFAAPSFWDRLLATGDTRAADRYSQAQNFDQLRASIARDLEGLLNTRLGWPDDTFTEFPESGNSILNYGLRDFAGMCLTSSEDRRVICGCVEDVIARFEPRLSGVEVSVFKLRCSPSQTTAIVQTSAATRSLLP